MWLSMVELLHTQTSTHTPFTFLGQVVHLMPPGLFLLELLEEAGPGVTAAQESIWPRRLGGAVPAVHIPPAASAVGLVKLHQQTVHYGSPRSLTSIPLGVRVTVTGRVAPLGGSDDARRSSVLGADLPLSRRWWCVIRWVGGASPLLETGEIIMEVGERVDEDTALVFGAPAAVTYVNFEEFTPVRS